MDQPTIEEWTQKASAMAEAQRATVVIGVRPYDRGWFANCAGHEVDGGGPSEALDGLLHVMLQAASHAAHKLRGDSTEANAIEAALEQIAE